MSDDLHRLLQVAPDTDPEALRAAYERQMSAAVRSHDHQRALELSSALDALPAGLRQRMYPWVSTRDRQMAVGPARRTGRRSSARTGVRRVAITLVVVAAVGAWVYWRVTIATGRA